MPYYHIRITQKGRTKDAIELNLLEKDLVRLILEKYRLREKFACGNKLVNPADVLEIKITKSEQPLKLGHPDFFRLEYRDLWRKVENQQDVTKKFVEFIPETMPLSKKVFIVHGRDHKPMKELKTILIGLSLTPIVLHEKPSGSRTILEKLEKYSDVGYAFVILTPDDVGSLDVRVSKNLESIEETLQNLVEAYTVIKRKGPLKKARGELSRVISLFKLRARQNVVLEFGYFMGLLGRDRVCCLYKGNVELPSDMHGIVYIAFKDSVEEARDMIVKELKVAGYKIEGQVAGYCDNCDKWSDVLEEIHVIGSENLKQVRHLCEKCNTNRLVRALIERTSDGTAKNHLMETEKFFAKNQERLQKVLREKIEDLRNLFSDAIKEKIGEEKERQFWHLLEKVSTARDPTQYVKSVKELLIFLLEKEIIRITLPFILATFLEETSSSTSPLELF